MPKISLDFLRRFTIVRDKPKPMCGAHAVVYSCVDRATGAMCAARIVKIKSNDTDFTASQRKWRSKNVQTAAEAHQRDPLMCLPQEVFYEDECMVEVMKYYFGGDLLERTRRNLLSESEIKRVALDIGTALHRIHSEGGVHGDVKPENILLSQSDHIEAAASVALCDFDMYRRVPHSETYAPGTSWYTAPEWGLRRTADLRRRQLNDMHALGSTLYVAAEGTWARRRNGTVRTSTNHFTKESTPDVHRVIFGLLESDVDLRWTAEQLISDPWVKTADALRPLSDK